MLLKKQKVYKVELARRLGNIDNLVGGLVWEDTWTDITEYFIERLDTVSTSLDDATLQGKLEQSSTSLRFDNLSGKFNAKGTSDSFWETTGYIYHSRVRLWEYYEDEDAEAEGLLPILDGLIAEDFKYREGMVADIRVNSKLDILREHYILEYLTIFNYTSSGTAILLYINNLLNTSYSELSIQIKSGILKKEVIYENISPYSDDLLSTFNSVINDGGGYGGLTRSNELFSAYPGASLVTQTNFETDGDCIGLYHMDDTDYVSGAGTTIYDKSGNSADLTTDNSIYNNWVSGGFFFNGVKTWYKTTVDSIWTDLTDLTIEILVKGTAFGAPRNQLGNQLTDLYTLNPIVIFSSYNGGNLYLSDGISTYYEEGIYLFDNHIYYMQITRHYWTGSTYLEWKIHSMIRLCPMLGENSIQYLAFVLDSTANSISTYVNGKLKKYIVPTVTLGTFYKAANMKVIGRCFSQIGSATAGQVRDFFDEMSSIYYHSMKFSDALKTDSQIFTQYEKLIGVDFVL